MVHNYSYEHLPPPSTQHQTYQPAPLHHSSSSFSDPRTLQPLGTSSSQPYPHSPYAYPPPPPPDMPMEYRQPSSPNYITHEQSLPHNLPPISAPVEQGYRSSPTMDTTGQVAPPGMRPRLTSSIFEEEGSLCFQVDVNGICVARREDNHYINGTKLLNVARMTRGRRDGILKAEKQKNVVKIGPMHLKGVWIPYDRALTLANQEKITEHLYPLFVHNIHTLLYHPINAARPVPLPPTYNRGDELELPRLNFGGPNTMSVLNGNRNGEGEEAARL